MTELVTLARPYAAAVFKRSKETNTTQEWAKSLSFMSTVLENQKILTVVSSPKYSKERLYGLMFDICQEQLVGRDGENFLKLLIQNGRLILIKTIAMLFDTLRAEQEGFVNAKVTSAYELTVEEQQSIGAMLERKLGKKAYIDIDVDKSLIGGVFIRTGDKVIDGSVKGQLLQLAKQLY